MIIINILFWLTFLLKINYGKVVTINALAYSQNGSNSLFTSLKNDFNKYSQENNLDIQLEINVFSNLNGTFRVENYLSSLDTILIRGSSKYDIVFYDHIYSKKYSPYLMDLKGLLPEEHIAMYMEGIANNTCIIKNKIIGLPVTIDYSVLYYNKELLKKYNQTVPETWDDLLQTGMYIRKNEPELNDVDKVDFTLFNGLFDNDESGFCSAYEFIYSYRESKDSDYPEFTSNEAIRAIQKIKEIKSKLASDKIFKEDEKYALDKLFSGKFLFLKFWHLPGIENLYGVKLLPGGKVGVSASVIGGDNIGINKSSLKKEQAVEVLKYLTSKEMQIKNVALSNYFSPIPSIYEDKEICEKIDCDYYKSIQLIARPTSQGYYENYVSTFMNYFNDFMYKNKLSATETLKNIKDITKNYHFTLSTEDTSVGLIAFLLVVFFILLFLSSLIYLYIYPSHFEFLPKDFWYLYIFGYVIILSTFFLSLSEQTLAKCHLNVIMLNIGFSLNIVPILYRLIISFPENNKFSEWVKKHRVTFLLVFILVDVVTNIVMSISPYTVKNKVYINEKRFQGCYMENTFGLYVIYFQYMIKLSILVSILVLIFEEWNIKSIYYDIRFLVIALYVDIILLVSIFTLSLLKIKNYIIHYSSQITVLSIYAVSNFMLFYGFRILFGYLKKDMLKKTYKDAFNRQLMKHRDNSRNTSKNLNKNVGGLGSLSSIPRSESGVKAFSQKMIGYHYRTETDSDDSSSNGSFDYLNFRPSL